MPDALSKTIPIWCSVMNRALFPDNLESHDVHTPEEVVSPSEHSQIEARLDGFLQSFLKLDVNLTELRRHISKPLLPMWVTPMTYTPSANEVIFEDYHPVICCSASRRVLGGEVSEGGYIQGTGDDTENWAFGLTPTVFWTKKRVLLSTPESELPELIARLLGRIPQPLKSEFNFPICVAPTSSLYIMALSDIVELPLYNEWLNICLHPEKSLEDTGKEGLRELHVPLGPHKLGSRTLRTVLATIVDFISRALVRDEARKGLQTSTAIVVACSNGKDHSVGVALALLCLFFDEDGNQHGLGKNAPMKNIDKAFVRRRLGWIMTSIPDANPSSATLQSVNSFLMGRPS
jgi:tRNA A64-2'-O-ribosylphosphate transferase